MSEPRPVAVVTGANSGIGRATTLHLARNGFSVYGTVRSVDKASKLNTAVSAENLDVTLVELDVADDQSVSSGFARILGQVGVIDVLVNNAGIAPAGVAEETPLATYVDTFNVNVCGVVRCVQSVLPGMRAARKGAIVNISSIVGRVAAIGQSPYVASKFALEGLSEALAQEVAPFGIRVAIIEPGVTRSAIFAKHVDTPNESGAYDATYRRMQAFYRIGLENATDPAEVAAVVQHAIATDRPALRYLISWGSQIVDARRSMTDEEWVRLGAHEDDAGYFDDFERHFGIRLSTTTVT